MVGTLGGGIAGTLGGRFKPGISAGIWFPLTCTPFTKGAAGEGGQHKTSTNLSNLFHHVSN